MAKIVDYNGRLAVDLGTIPNWFEPRLEHTLSVAPEGVRSADWPHLIGCEVEFAGNLGMVKVPLATRPTWVNTEDWEHVVEAEPIKKPRKGRGYDWIWQYGRWDRVAA